MTEPTHLDDVMFVLDAVCDPYAGEWSRETVADVLGNFSKFVIDKVQPTNADGDAVGARLVDGRVRMPDSLKALFADYVEQGWQALAMPEEAGGMGAPHAVAGGASEMLTAANHGFQITVSLAVGAMRAVIASGSEDQINLLAENLVSGEGLATMCLTEPGAGSDLGRIRTKAVDQGGGKYAISGEKIFITGGDQDFTDKVFHLVLARTGSMEDGVAGLSLFLCPAQNPDGSRNGITVARIEEKMGVHASPTCQLVFDNAEAELVGNLGEGLKGMFVMMNHARLDVALQGSAHAARATEIARAYAADRIQGRTKAHPGGAPIIEHGDVQRMIAHMDALQLGARAMCLRALDMLEKNADLVEFLTPVVKAFATDAGSEAADTGQQVLGGYGYLKEYGLEQIVRDARIARIYEGTNGIQSITLVKRLLRGGNGAWLNAFLADVADAEASAAPDAAAAIADVRAAWQAAAESVGGAPDSTLPAVPFMKLTGLLYFMAMWARMEQKADLASDPERIRALARFARDALAPEALALRQIVANLSKRTELLTN